MPRCAPTGDRRPSPGAAGFGAHAAGRGAPCAPTRAVRPKPDSGVIAGVGCRRPRAASPRSAPSRCAASPTARSGRWVVPRIQSSRCFSWSNTCAVVRPSSIFPSTYLIAPSNSPKACGIVQAEVDEVVGAVGPGTGTCSSMTRNPSSRRRIRLMLSPGSWARPSAKSRTRSSARESVRGSPGDHERSPAGTLLRHRGRTRRPAARTAGGARRPPPSPPARTRPCAPCRRRCVRARCTAVRRSPRHPRPELTAMAITPPAAPGRPSGAMTCTRRGSARYRGSRARRRGFVGADRRRRGGERERTGASDDAHLGLGGSPVLARRRSRRGEGA